MMANLKSQIPNLKSLLAFGLLMLAVGSASAATNTYLVVDLSGGVNAASYPVTYLSDVPAGGWTDEYKTTKLVLRKIPAGTFVMGSPTDELGRKSDETQHQVTLTKDFYIGVFEVTQRQFELVKDQKPSYFNNVTYYAKRPVEQVSYYRIREGFDSAISPNWPASNAVGAGSFMDKLRVKTGIPTFDLPTESQWEYACRAGTTTALNSGNNLTSTTNDGNMAMVGRYFFNGGYGSTSSSMLNLGTAPAGNYLPNQWGLYDMHGNVGEWCLDWYDGGYPGTVTDPVGAGFGSYRMIRGGWFESSSGACRSASPCASAPPRPARTPASFSGAAPGIRPARACGRSTPLDFLRRPPTPQ
jgi:formylglycine-generating enzyme required for sulfatase activity